MISLDSELWILMINKIDHTSCMHALIWLAVYEAFTFSKDNQHSELGDIRLIHAIHKEKTAAWQTEQQSLDQDHIVS